MIAPKERQDILHLNVRIIDVAPAHNGFVRLTAETEDGGIFNCRMKEEEAAKFQWGEGDFLIGFNEEEVQEFKLQKFLKN